ncbi:MAG: hypothetical protein ACOYM3_16705 [Terrimicrobiaceae bacterium]
MKKAPAPAFVMFPVTVRLLVAGSVLLISQLLVKLVRFISLTVMLVLYEIAMLPKLVGLTKVSDAVGATPPTHAAGVDQTVLMVPFQLKFAEYAELNPDRQRRVVRRNALLRQMMEGMRFFITAGIFTISPCGVNKKVTSMFFYWK